MTWQPVPLPDGSYKDDTRPYTDQDLQNYLPVFAETQGTRSPMKLVGVPGLREYASLGDGPIRGMHDAEGKFVVVSGQTAYWLKSPTQAQVLGTIPGRALVWIVHNQITNGNEVLFSTGPDAWIWNTVTSDFTQISDDAFRGAISPEYLKSYFLGIESQRRFFANSSLAAGLEWDSIERYESESCPDRLQCLVASHNELAVFNDRTIEFFEATTNPDDIANHILFTTKGIVVEVGGASKRCASRLDNAIFFVGSDGSGYRLNGYTPQRITPFALEQAWRKCDLSKCFTFTYEDRGHKIWYVTFPDGLTWGYDCASQKWHRRQSKGMNRWRVNCLVRWKGDWYGGSFNSGIIYQLDWDYTLEGCDELASSFTTGVLHDEGNRITVNGLRIEFDSGSEVSVCEDADPIVPTGAGFISSGLLVSPPPGVAVSLYTADTMADTFALVTNDLDFTAQSGGGIGAVGSYVVIAHNGTRDTFRAQSPFPTWEYVDAGATFSQMCIHDGKVVCMGLALRVSSDDGASYSAQAYTAMTPSGGATTVTSQDSLKSLDGKLVFGGNNSGNSCLQYSTSLSAFTVVDVGSGDNCNIPTFDYTGTHWIAATAKGQIYRASSISGPYTLVMDTGDLIDAGYYPQVTAHNDSGLVLMCWAHADTTQKLLVSNDHGATWADESGTFPGFSGALTVIDNVFYQGWDKTTDGVAWTLHSLSGADEFERFDGIAEYTV